MERRVAGGEVGWDGVPFAGAQRGFDDGRRPILRAVDVCQFLYVLYRVAGRGRWWVY